MAFCKSIFDVSHNLSFCLMNDLDNPFSYKLLPGFLLKIPNNVDSILTLIQMNRGTK